MGEVTGIEWCDHTMNFWIGCQEVSPACDHCYARVQNERRKWVDGWGPHGERRRTAPSTWHQLRRWNKAAEAAGVRARVFPNSLSDFFDNATHVSQWRLSQWRREAWHYIEQCPSLDFLILTKRPQNIRSMLPDPETGVRPWGDGWPNVWLGTTAENQNQLAVNAWALSHIPAKIRFLSCEPLLQYLNTRRVVNRWGTEWDLLTGRILHAEGASPASTGAIQWVIAGGESGPKARPMNPTWARGLRDQCAAAGVPFFFKQWGEWAPPQTDQQREAVRRGDGIFGALSESGSIVDKGSAVVRVGKKAAGAMLDGREHREFPA